MSAAGAVAPAGESSAGGTAELGRVALEPDLTIITAAETKARLVKELEEHEALELDLSHVVEMDTAGLQVLLLAAREGRASGKPVRFMGHTRVVQAVLELAHLTEELAEHRAEEERS